MSEIQTPVSWSIFPLAEDMKKAAFFLFAVVVCPVVIEAAFHERWLTILSMLFLLGSLRMFWTPTWFELTDEGVVVRTPFYKVVHKWERFKVIKDDPRGLILTPFKSDSRLEAFRGLFLRLPPRDELLKKEVRAQCKHFLGIAPEPTATSESAA